MPALSPAEGSAPIGPDRVAHLKQFKENLGQEFKSARSNVAVIIPASEQAAGAVDPGDLRHRGLIQTALKKYEVARGKKASAFGDWQSARQAAAETKWDAINHLDTYLDEFATKLEARGTKVHWASTATQAREIILGIIKAKNARCVIKSKAMTAEEIHLNDAMEKAGKLKRIAFADRAALKKAVDPVMAEYAKEIGAEQLLAKINAIK